MLTTEKVCNGEFNVLWNGKLTSWRIVNGSIGLSGKDSRNTYGVVKAGNPPKWIGSLATCKKLLSDKFTKESKTF